MPPKSRTVLLDGERCHKLREQKGLSREALAELSKGPDAISVATIKRAECGKAIFLHTASTLAKLLGASLESLVARGGTSSEEVASTRKSQACLAVLPFEAQGADENSRIFADGLVEDIIHRLATFWFPVIARSSSFSLRGQVLDARVAGERLGADYLVEGSVRSHGAKTRTTAALVDADSGLQLWGGCYDASHDERAAQHDRLCIDIVGQIGHKVLDVEATRAAHCNTVDEDAWQLALRGTWHFHRSTAEDNEKARGYLHRALAREPTLALARYFLVLSHQHDLLNQWTRDADATRTEMRAQAKEFERILPGSSWMYVATAYSAIAHGDRSEATARLLEALELDPNSVSAHSLYGQALAMGSKAAQGLHELELARILSPHDNGMWAMMLTTGLAHFAAAEYAEAADWASRAIIKRPLVPTCYAALAAAQALAGSTKLARDTLARMQAQGLSMSSRGFKAVVGATDVEIAERFFDGLRLAGLPD